ARPTTVTGGFRFLSRAARRGRRETSPIILPHDELTRRQCSARDQSALGTPEHRYIPSLDGPRAVCIARVLVIPMPPRRRHRWLGAGRARRWYGLDMFFLVRGLLITWILAVEAEATGTVSLGRFYRARTLRLLPAYCTTIVLVLAGSRLFGIAEGNASYR